MSAFNLLAAFDESSSELSPDYLRKTGMLSLCAADRCDVTELRTILRLKGEPGAAVQLFAGEYRQPLRSIATARAGILMKVRWRYPASNIMIVVDSRYAIFEPDTGEFHVIFGPRHELKDKFDVLKRHVDYHWDSYVNASIWTQQGRTTMKNIWSRYTIL